MTFKIVLLGYMGSGKSTVGEDLANRLNVSFKDLDKEIEFLEKKTVSEIFDAKGAIYFRKLEKSILEKLISKDDSIILSLGGGTPCYFDTMTYLNNFNDVHTVYLDLSIPTLVNRLYRDHGLRPLLKNIKSKQQLSEFIGKHLFERRPFYNQAKLSLKFTDESPEHISQKIVANLF